MRGGIVFGIAKKKDYSFSYSSNEKAYRKYNTTITLALCWKKLSVISLETCNKSRLRIVIYL